MLNISKEDIEAIRELVKDGGIKKKRICQEFKISYYQLNTKILGNKQYKAVPKNKQKKRGPKKMKLSKETIDEIMIDVNNGEKKSEIMRRYDISRYILNRIIKENPKKPYSSCFFF